MSPRLNKKNSPGASKKFNSIIFNQDLNYHTVELFLWKPLINSSGSIDTTGGITIIEFQNTVNTIVNTDSFTNFKIPLVPNDRISTENGTIKCKLIGAGEKPLEGQVKGNNTLSWLETIETLEIEVIGGYNPSQYLDIFSFEDIRENVVTDDGGNKVTRSKIFYVSKAEPITDSLREGNPITATRITLTSGITSLLQNPDSGGLLEIDYVVEPIQPSNAAYMVVTYASYMHHNSFTGVDSNGVPLTMSRVSELNKETQLSGVENNKEYLTSDNMLIDGVYPKTITQQKVKMHSWMSGEIYNKIRVWDSFFVDACKGTHLCPVTDFTEEDGIFNGFNGAYIVAPDYEYSSFVVGDRLQFNDEFLNALKYNTETNGIKSWYNSFSFFENLYYKNPQIGSGNATPNWKQSNTFFTFDVQAGVGSTNKVGEFIASNPRKNIYNPNFTEEDYDNFVNEATYGSVIINGGTFNAWDTIFSQVNKPDNLYDWDDNEENRKYLVVTPGQDYIKRTNKIIESGGKTSQDNDVTLKTFVGAGSAVQKFPTGDGSKWFSYPNDIFFSREYCLNEGWEVDNKIVSKFNGEKTIQLININAWGGEKIKVEFFDSKGNPAVGLDQDGNKVMLPPTTIKAANQDASGNPLKTTSTLVFGFTIN